MQYGWAAPNRRTQLKKQKYKKDHPGAKGISQKIMKCIALDNQPFSIVQDAGFTKPVEYLEPRFAMPSRKYFTDVCLLELCSVVYSHVKKLN